MKQCEKPQPELSRPLGVDKIPAGGMEEHIVARPLERNELAARFDLIDLTRLEAWLNIDHAEGKMIAVTGRLEADIVQTCVVSLEPFSSTVTDSIDILFAPPGSLGSGSPNFDAGPEDDPEPIINGEIDLGELVAQHLGVALDPYPRKPGAQLSYQRDEGASAIPVETGGATTKPFANLASLCREGKGKKG